MNKTIKDHFESMVSPAHCETDPVNDLECFADEMYDEVKKYISRDGHNRDVAKQKYITIEKLYAILDKFHKLPNYPIWAICEDEIQRLRSRGTEDALGIIFPISLREVRSDHIALLDFTKLWNGKN